MKSANTNLTQRDREKIHRILDGDDPLVIVSHRNPDGDALGAMLALARWSADRGRKAVAVSPEGAPAPYAFLPGADSIGLEFPDDTTGFGLVSLDAPDASRLDLPSTLLETADPVLNIDHHPGNTLFGTVNLVDPGASSTCLLLFEILEPYGGLSTEIATLLYTGVFTDTGGFRFGNTDARTLAAAAGLVELGAPPAEIARRVYAQQPIGRLRLLGLVLGTATTEFEGQVAVLTLTDEMRRETGSSGEDLEGLASHGRLVEGVRVAVLLREQQGSVRASLRSAGEVDVNAVARVLGGGGHSAAAGVVIPGTIAEARARILTTVAEFL